MVFPGDYEQPVLLGSCRPEQLHHLRMVIGKVIRIREQGSGSVQDQGSWNIDQEGDQDHETWIKDQEGVQDQGTVIRKT